jgi:hypothetical protein
MKVKEKTEKLKTKKAKNEKDYEMMLIQMLEGELKKDDK